MQCRVKRRACANDHATCSEGEKGENIKGRDRGQGGGKKREDIITQRPQLGSQPDACGKRLRCILRPFSLFCVLLE
eukprot:8924310-Pyramimonas_sp.AAC.1